MLTLKNIRKNYGTRRVLDRISFSLGEGQKVALVGQNGVGKSTLLRIIAGEETPDRGEISTPNRAFIGYLPQETLPLVRETLREYLRRVTGITDLEAEMAALEPRLDDLKVLEKYEASDAMYRRLGGYDFERKAKNLLEGLGLSHISLDRKVAELSGGEKRKATLIGVLMRGVDILLLDEPTNDLDLPALLWLERYLKRSKATCLIASHDRRFLDTVVEKVIEIDWYKRTATMYTGGWSEFAEMRAHAIRSQMEAYRMEAEERQRLYVSIDEKKAWVERVKESVAPDHDKLTSNYKKERAIKKFDASAKSMESREKKLHKTEKPLIRDPLNITLEASEAKEEDQEADVIALKEVRFGYEKGVVFGPVDLRIPFGARISILGNNGVGKSTLLKTISGAREPISGTIHRGSTLRFGFVMQEHENIASSDTLLTTFKKRLELNDRDEIAKYLSEFQFAPDVIDDKVESLSPGERVRLVLALLTASGANVLVLDEPTNHLDLEAIEALEEALESYAGTILLVTHDRKFLEKMRLTQSYLLEKGKLEPIKDYQAYEESVAAQVARIMKRFEEKHRS